MYHTPVDWRQEAQRYAQNYADDMAAETRRSKRENCVGGGNNAAEEAHTNYLKYLVRLPSRFLGIVMCRSRRPPHTNFA